MHVALSNQWILRVSMSKYETILLFYVCVVCVFLHNAQRKRKFMSSNQLTPGAAETASLDSEAAV